MAEKIELQKYLVSQGWYFNPNYRRENYKYSKTLFDDNKYTCKAVFHIDDEKNIGTSLSLELYVNLKQTTIPNKHMSYLIYRVLPEMNPRISFIKSWEENKVILSIDTFRIGLTISPNRLKKLQSIIDKIDSNYIDNFIEEYKKAYKESNDAEQKIINQYLDNGYKLYDNWRDDVYVKKVNTKDFDVVEVLAMGIDGRDVQFIITTSRPCNLSYRTRRTLNDEYVNILDPKVRVWLTEHTSNYTFTYILRNGEEVATEKYLNTIKTLSDGNLINELLNYLINLYEEAASKMPEE